VDNLRPVDPRSRPEIPHGGGEEVGQALSKRLPAYWTHAPLTCTCQKVAHPPEGLCRGTVNTDRRSDRPKHRRASLRASVMYDRSAQDGSRGYLHSNLSEY
jgi:hypothetical protein